MTEPWLALLERMMRGLPALPGARCRGKPHLFDGGPSGEDSDVRDARQGQALALCQRCPSLQRCLEWHDSLPRRQRPAGVIAGRVNLVNPAGRPRIEPQRKGTNR